MSYFPAGMVKGTQSGTGEWSGAGGGGLPFGIQSEASSSYKAVKCMGWSPKPSAALEKSHTQQVLPKQERQKVSQQQGEETQLTDRS